MIHDPKDTVRRFTDNRVRGTFQHGANQVQAHYRPFVHADWQQLASATSLVVALDLDGTLLPFAATPHDAIVDAETGALLAAVADAPGVTCGIISGRPRELIGDLVTRFPHVAWAAE